MISQCPYCSSEKVRRSKSYEDMWFCPNCGKGDYLSITKNLKIKKIDAPTGSFNSFLLKFGILKKDQKSLLILQGSTLNYYEQVFHAKRIFLTKIDPKSLEYSNIKKTSCGVFVFRSQPKYWLINDDFEALEFDNIVIQDGVSKENIQHTINHLQSLYKKNKAKKDTNLYIF